MDDRQKQEGFSYWKRPWGKWFTLAGGIFELLALRLNVREYNRIAAAGILRKPTNPSRYFCAIPEKKHFFAKVLKHDIYRLKELCYSS